MMASGVGGWMGLRLDPLDTLLFRDGRPFDATARVSAGLPYPQTMAGAVRTELLAKQGLDFRAFDDGLRAEHAQAATEQREPDPKRVLARCGAPRWILDARFRGPWLALASLDGRIEPLLPQPIIMMRTRDGGWLRMMPEMEGVPGWHDLDGLRPLWHDGEPDTKVEASFWTLTAVGEFLDGNDSPEQAQMFCPGDLYAYDDRTGIALDMDTLMPAEGRLYGIRLLALAPKVLRADGQYRGAQVCLYAEIHTDGEDVARFLADPLSFGGEGRYVRASVVPACAWPAPRRQDVRSLLYLAAPAFFLGRLPRFVNGIRLRAAASGPGLAVSGWDVARRGPRPTRFAVPAGAIYFIEGAVDLEQSSLCPEPEAAEGWGFALQGLW